jgi:hypothetical protein
MTLQNDMDDWWADHKRQEDEIQQLELELAKIRQEVERMKVYPQDIFTDANGTSLQGYVRADYSELVAAFGEPLEGDGCKTQAEWVLVFEVPQDDGYADRVVATIYDWKKYDQTVEDITQWNIGGHDPRAPELVIDYLNYQRDMERGEISPNGRPYLKANYA